MRAAIIGSRTASADVLAVLRLIAVWCREHGWTITSGHAQGCDYAAEEGGLKSCVVYLPWPTFNSGLLMLGSPIVIRDSNKPLDELVDKFHPAPQNLSRGARALMRRNGAQILGESLDEPVDVVICWTNPKKGGTTQALRIAEANKIPILNLWEHSPEQLVEHKSIVECYISLLEKMEESNGVVRL